MNEKIRIFAHRTAREEKINQAQEIAHKIGIAEISPIVFPMEPIAENVQIVIGVGGDGTIRTITEQMMKRKTPGYLLVIPGGSQNGFWRSLVNENAIAKIEQINEESLVHLPDFHPGRVSIGEGKKEFLFNHVAEFGDQLKIFSKLNEGLRKSRIPRTARVFVAMGKFISGAGQKVIRSENDSINLVMTSPYIGSLNLIKRQSLYDGKVTKISINDDRPLNMLRKLFVISAYLMIRHTPPKAIVDIDQKSNFTFPNEDERYKIVALGGDVFPLSHKGDIYVSRSEKSIKAAAVVTE